MLGGRWQGGLALAASPSRAVLPQSYCPESEHMSRHMSVERGESSTCHGSQESEHMSRHMPGDSHCDSWRRWYDGDRGRWSCANMETGDAGRVQASSTS